MTKNYRKVLCALLLIAVLLFTTACSFFGEDETRQIANIYSYHDDDNACTVVVIQYEGDEYEDSVFTIPDALEGKEGTGIRNVSAVTTEDGLYTIITIEYTDLTMDSQEIRIPNGIFPTGMTTEVDEETGDLTVTITLSDGTKQTFSLHNGVDGKDGDTIVSIETVVETDEETGEEVTWMVITLERIDEETGEHVTYRLRMPEGAEGKQGKGILGIELDSSRTASDVSNIWLRVTYDDYTYESISIPKVNNWHNGDGKPGDGQYNVGDYYVDTANHIIYYKTVTGTWQILFDFSDFSVQEHIVYFYLDKDTISDSVTIAHGNSFLASSKELPTPERTGYRFVGWYTEYFEIGEADYAHPNAGHFTSLTPVLSNMALYARWEPLN